MLHSNKIHDTCKISIPYELCFMTLSLWDSHDINVRQMTPHYPRVHVLLTVKNITDFTNTALRPPSLPLYIPFT